MGRPKVRTGSGSRRMLVEGWVRVKQGRKVVVPWVRNHFVNYGLLSIVSWLTIQNLASTESVPARQGYWTIRLGHNTTTATTATMTGLVNEVTTEPNTTTRANDNPATGQYRAKYSATWNAGTVSGTVGELGLRMFIWTELQPAGAGAGAPTSKALASRISAGDGDFSAFTIDTTKPLAVEWHVRFIFA